MGWPLTLLLQETVGLRCALLQIRVARGLQEDRDLLEDGWGAGRGLGLLSTTFPPKSPPWGHAAPLRPFPHQGFRRALLTAVVEGRGWGAPGVVLHKESCSGVQGAQGPAPTQHTAYLQVSAERFQQLVGGLTLAQRHKEELRAERWAVSSPPRPHPYRPLPRLTLSPCSVRMLSALGTSSAVLVFLKAQTEATGTTACGEQAWSDPEPPHHPTPAPRPHLDVPEQQAGVEAEVPGGDIEAAVVGHLALPGAGEGGQQSLAPCDLLKGFMEGSTVLVELWGSRGVGLSPGTPSTDHKMGMGSPLLSPRTHWV